MRKYRAVSLALVLGLTLTTAPALAKTPKPTLAEIEAAKKVEAAKKKAADAQAAKLAAANQTLRSLTAKASTAKSLYVKAQNELAVANAAAKAAAQYAAETAASVNQARRVIGRLASNAYIMGGSLTDIQPLLSASGPQELVDQLSILSTLGSKNTVSLERFKAAEVVARSAKKAADDAKAAQAAEVAKLQKVQDALMKDLLNARKVRTTLQQQRELALLEENNANTAANTPGQKSIWPDKGFKGRSTFRTTQEQRDKAVAYAKIQVLARKPYVWGAQGPKSFDCSGLVFAAYRSAGLNWPNWDRLNAALYSTYTKHVTLNQLVPGDLLFYSYNGSISSIHHITIYAGNGMMWEANSKSRGLLFSNMYSIKGLMPFGGRV